MLFVSAEAQQAEQQKLIRMQQEGQALSAELSEKLALKQQSLPRGYDEVDPRAAQGLQQGWPLQAHPHQGRRQHPLAEDALDITEDFIKYHQRALQRWRRRPG